MGTIDWLRQIIGFIEMTDYWFYRNDKDCKVR